VKINIFQFDFELLKNIDFQEGSSHF